MLEPKFTLKGVTGHLQVFPDKIVIERKGFIAKMNHGLFKGDKSLFLKQISGIQVKQAGMFTNGYIQFTLIGGIEGRKGLLEATKDENTVMFRKADNDLVKEIQSYIESRINNDSQGSTSIADELIKLKDLVDKGILTQDEFEKKKAEMLA